MKDSKPSESARPTCWVVCRALGLPSEVWLYRQVRAMRRLKPEVVTWSHENRDQFPADGFKLRCLPYDVAPQDGPRRWQWRLANLVGRNFYGSIGREADTLRQWIDETGPGVILAQYGHVGLRVLPAARAAKVPVVVHFHGNDITASLGNPWYRSSLIRALRHFERMVVVAEYQRDVLVGLGAESSRISVIPCGVPVSDFPRSKGVDAQPCRFLSVGRFAEKKSPLLVLKAFARCREVVPDATLTMVGDGSLLDKAKALAAELDLSNSVNFSGTLPPPEVAREMAQASVFLQHSVTAASGDKEGWPVSIAEAMAAGLPVIATRHAGIPDQVVEGVTGHLVEEKDWQSMAECMIRLALDPATRSEQGLAAANRARDSFDLNLSVSRLENVLLDTLHSPLGVA